MSEVIKKEDIKCEGPKINALSREDAKRQAEEQGVNSDWRIGWSAGPAITARVILTVGFIVVSLRGGTNYPSVGGSTAPAPFTGRVFVKLPFVSRDSHLLSMW